MAKAYDKNRT
jgi:hypothetical protein